MIGIDKHKTYGSIMSHVIRMSLFLLISYTMASGQIMPLHWKLSSGDLEKVSDILTLPDSLDQDRLLDSCGSILGSLHAKGYLEASMDHIEQSAISVTITPHIGPQYEWSLLDLSTIPAVIAEQLNFRSLTHRSYSHQQIAALFEQILKHAENSGYPFAAVRLDSMGFEEGLIRARVLVRLNQMVTIEAIKVEGDLKLKERYLNHFLDLSVGDPFNKEKVVRSRDQLQTLPFLKTFADPTIEFLGEGATLHLFLNKKNANRFDILLGLLPSPAENRRFQLTGNVNIDMYNQLGGGERLMAIFESLQPGVQELELGANYPFLFDWSFGTDAHFNLYKRDSSYIDVGYELGVQYFLKRSNYVKFFIERQGTNLITIDTNRIKRRKMLPDFIDVSRNLLGVAYHLENLNYRLNPRRGYFMTMKVSAGNKRIRKNDVITALTDGEASFDYSKLYNHLDLSSFQYRLSNVLDWYMPVFKNSTIKLSNASALIGSGEALYQNELFRIGGTQLLRGFNEESIFASFYSVFSAEYRLLFNQNSNIFLFADLAYAEAHTEQDFSADRFFGTGVGLNLETKVGIFGISYAIGTQRGLPLSFSSGRIHFGMVAGF